MVWFEGLELGIVSACVLERQSWSCDEGFDSADPNDKCRPQSHFKTAASSLRAGIAPYGTCTCMRGCVYAPIYIFPRLRIRQTLPLSPAPLLVSFPTYLGAMARLGLQTRPGSGYNSKLKRW